MLAPPPKASTEAARPPALARVITAEPPNSMVSLTGLRAARPRLASDDRSGGSTLRAAKLRPWRVAITMPMTAATAARTASSVLLGGQLERLARAAAARPGEEDHQEHQVDQGSGEGADPRRRPRPRSARRRLSAGTARS